MRSTREYYGRFYSARKWKGLFFKVSGHVLIPIDSLQIVAANQELQAKLSNYPKISAYVPEIFLA